ncbi:MAG: pyruvate kinase [Bdellovibrionales bacterium]
MIADRRVKIVATIGPATSSKENLKKCIESGMNVARLNFSHGTHEDHVQVIRSIRELTSELKAPVAILQDLQGPKIRVGRFSAGSIELEGQKIVIKADRVDSDGVSIPTDFKELPESCSAGTRILLDDGLLELRVIKVVERDVHCEVVFGGTLKNRKGMNLPGAMLPVECMTPKDLDDLEFGLSQKVDYVALSFVRRGSDLRKLRELVDLKNPATRIVAKIEMLEAIDNLREIIQLSDGVMVARGDLAVEVGQTHLPKLQKEIISMCNELGRPVITATQMLDSMVENPRPTRAEITDVANAVLDGSDACMLSAESASGKYPFKCITTMSDIIMEVEKDSDFYYDINLNKELLTIADTIAEGACLAALKLNASAIVCLTTSGKTASLISAYRPKARVIAVTHMQDTLNRLELVWGIQTLRIKPYKSTDEAMSQIQRLLLEYGLVEQGDRVVLTLGVPVLEQSKTNSLRVYTIVGKAPQNVDKSTHPLRVR